jgi:hypothetical protein
MNGVTMGERIALDYTNGAGEPIPTETWTGISPEDVVKYARSRVPEESKYLLNDDMSLIELIRLVDVRLDDKTRELVQQLLGKEELEIDKAIR